MALTCLTGETMRGIDLWTLIQEAQEHLLRCADCHDRRLQLQNKVEVRLAAMQEPYAGSPISQGAPARMNPANQLFLTP